MKNQILDTPFRDSFQDFLEKDEKILWKGAPSLKVPVLKTNSTINEMITTMILVGTFLLLFGIAIYPKVLLGVLILIFVGSYFLYFRNNQKHHIRYAVTSQQVLFQLPKTWRKGNEFYSISMDNIRRVEFNMDVDFDNVGNIFLSIEDKNQVRFTTRNLRVGKKRFLPTLELIDNPKKVVDLIRQGIKNANTST